MMVINEHKTKLYKHKIAHCIKEHGKLAKSRIGYLCGMHLYTTGEIINEMVEDGTLIKIDGLIILYDLKEENNGKKN